MKGAFFFPKNFINKDIDFSRIMDTTPDVANFLQHVKWLKWDFIYK